VDLRIIERDRSRGEFLAASLRQALILNGDGTDLELLESEQIGRSDVLVSVIDNDERNLFASLLGRQLGVRKTITRVSRPANLRLFERVGIDVALSARGAAVASVVHQIQGGRANLLAVLEEGQATVLELVVPAGYRPAGPAGTRRPAGLDRRRHPPRHRGDRAARLRTRSARTIASSCSRRRGRPPASATTSPARPDAPAGRPPPRRDAPAAVQPHVRRAGRGRVAVRRTGGRRGVPADRDGLAGVAQALVTAGRAGDDLRRVEALAVVAGTWILVAHAAAVPYVFRGHGFVDAFFESMSGLTTTGATILRDFSPYGRGLFFWRSMTQWLGGLASSRCSSPCCRACRSPGASCSSPRRPGPTDEKLTPQIRKTAAALWSVYAGLTVLQVLALLGAGMDLYDSVCHAFTTLSAGGFSPHPAVDCRLREPAVEWVIIVFMFLAGANFALHYRTLRGERTVLPRDEEFRAYAGIVLVATALIALLLVAARDAGLVDASATRSSRC
jgi:hypothetical protein